MKRRMESHIATLALAAGVLVCASSCVSTSVPTHGGGKRYFYEQAIVARAADEAFGQLDLSALKQRTESKPVEVYVIAMGDEGGGVDAGGSITSAIGLTSGSFVPSTSGVSATGAAGAAQMTSGTASSSHAFANARDIEYLRGRAIQVLTGAGVQIATAATARESTAGAVYFLVSEYGTAKDNLQLVVYSETNLAARACIDGYFVPGNQPRGADATLVSLGRGECTTLYRTEFIFGYGPINGGEIIVTPGPIPTRIVRAPAANASSAN